MTNRNLKILLVEDDGDIRELVSILLEDAGHVVVGKSNGHEALVYLQNDPKPPNIILLDMMMPVKNGLEFRKEQLEDDRIKHIPVLVMSADNSAEKHFQNFSIKGCLKKPIDVALLLRMVVSHAHL